MRFFTLIDLHHLILAFFLGLAAALVIYISFRYGRDEKEERPVDEEPREDYFVEDETVNSRPIPPVLVFVCAGVMLSIIAYVVFSFMRGAL